MSLSKADILGADDLPREEVPVPEWQGTVFVRTMTGEERDGFEQSIIDGEKRKLDNIRAKLAALTVVDENGERLFEEGDIAELGKKSAAALDRVFAVAQRLNGLTGEDVESLAKN